MTDLSVGFRIRQGRDVRVAAGDEIDRSVADTAQSIDASLSALESSSGRGALTVLNPYAARLAELAGLFADQHTETTSTTLTRGFSNAVSFIGDDAAYSSSNLDGQVVTGNATRASSDNYAEGLDAPVSPANVSAGNLGNFILLHIRINSYDPSNGTTMTIWGARDTNTIEYPFLRIFNQDSVGSDSRKLQLNTQGIRTADLRHATWENLRRTDTFGDVVFTAGDQIDLVIQFQRLSSTSIIAVQGAGRIGSGAAFSLTGPAVSTAGMTIANTSIDLTRPTGEIQSGRRWEVANSDTYHIHNELRAMLDDRRDDRLLGNMILSTHSTEYHQLSGDWNFPDTLYVKGVAVTGGGGGNGGSGGGTSDPSTGDYLHLGTGTFSESLAEGSAEKTGLVAAQRTALAIGSTSITTTTLRFDETLTGASIPGGSGNYTNTNGEIVLPEGHWIVCTSVKVRFVSNGSTGSNATRLFADLAINYGGNSRHKQSGYIRAAETPGIPGTQSNGTNGDAFAAAYWMSVSGAVVSDGTTPLTVVLETLLQTSTGTFRLEGAHIHSYKQVI